MSVLVLLLLCLWQGENAIAEERHDERETEREQEHRGQMFPK
jgi:hypothetical protein